MQNFNNITDLELIDWYANEHETHSDVDLLYKVECWADENGLIDSAEALSELFDAEVALSVVKRHGVNDKPAMLEAFNNFTDLICADGDLHQLQCDNYSYVGVYS